MWKRDTPCAIFDSGEARVYIRNERQKPFVLTCSVGDERVLESVAPPLGKSTTEQIVTLRANRFLSVDLLSLNEHAAVEGLVPIAEDGNRIDVWAVDDAPPIVRVNGFPLTGPGMRYGRAAREQVVSESGSSSPLLMRDRTLGLCDLSTGHVVWIEGRKIKRKGPLFDEHSRLIHTGRLEPGRHRITVLDASARQILVDTEVVSDGLRPIVIEVSERDGFFVRAAGRDAFGPVEMFRAAGSKQLLFETDPGRTMINGNILPEEIRKALAKLREAMENEKEKTQYFYDGYAWFLEERERVRQKVARGETLTDEERVISEANDTSAMNDVLYAKEESEGVQSMTLACTDLTARVHWKGGTPETLRDVIKKYEAMEIHEPSHVSSMLQDMDEFGLDVDEFRKYMDLMEHGNPLDMNQDDYDEMIAWFDANLPKIEEYRARRADSERSAREEVREYGEGLLFYCSILRLMKHPLVRDWFDALEEEND